jgi:hypothetical protein
VSRSRAGDDADETAAPELGIDEDGELHEVWCSLCDIAPDCLDAHAHKASVDAFERWVLDVDEAERDALATLEDGEREALASHE